MEPPLPNEDKSKEQILVTFLKQKQGRRTDSLKESQGQVFQV